VEITMAENKKSIDDVSPQEWNTAHLHHLQKSITQNVEEHSEYYYDFDRNKPLKDGANGTTKDDLWKSVSEGGV